MRDNGGAESVPQNCTYRRIRVLALAEVRPGSVPNWRATVSAAMSLSQLLLVSVACSGSDLSARTVGVEECAHGCAGVLL
jgi:hypothetical protein